MSTDFYMNAVVGVRVIKEEIFTNIQEANCLHQHAYKFCPECGKPAGTHTDTVMIPGFEEDEENGGHTFNGLSVVTPYYLNQSRPDDPVVIGVVIGRSKSHAHKEGRDVKCEMITDRILLAVNEALAGSVFDKKERALYMVLESR